MKQFAVAISAYNPMLEKPRLNSFLTLLPTDKTKPLQCKVSIYIAPTAEKAEELALTHGQSVFPTNRGWRQHTVAVCNIEATLLR